MIRITDIAVVGADIRSLKGGYRCGLPRYPHNGFPPRRALWRGRSDRPSPSLEAELPRLPASALLPKPRRHPPVRDSEIDLLRPVIGSKGSVELPHSVPLRAHSQKYWAPRPIWILGFVL